MLQLSGSKQNKKRKETQKDVRKPFTPSSCLTCPFEGQRIQWKPESSPQLTRKAQTLQST
jgi:hypothetical protein